MGNKMYTRTWIMVILFFIPFLLISQNNMSKNSDLSPVEQSIVAIAAFTAKGDLPPLKLKLNSGLDEGLTINQIKEVLVHLYAYCGFPRSIMGLQTLMEVVSERKARGIRDVTGAEAAPILDERSKYERGREILGKLSGAPQNGPATGYSTFAPVIDTFLKEHLFADIFERDVLTYSQRELATISVLSTLGGVKPMLRGHLSICLNVGYSPEQLNQFCTIIQFIVGEEKIKEVREVLKEILKTRERN